jgi:hypothetical protein
LFGADGHSHGGTELENAHEHRPFPPAGTDAVKLGDASRLR